MNDPFGEFSAYMAAWDRYMQDMQEAFVRFRVATATEADFEKWRRARPEALAITYETWLIGERQE